MTVGSMIPTSTVPEPPATPRQSLLRVVLVVVGFALLAYFRAPWALFLVLLLASITLHELGHYLGARWGGMKPTEFFIGFGPRIFSFRRGDTEYGLKPILLGAYVKVPGMNNLEEVSEEDEPRTYRAQSYGRRARMVFAGPAMNLLIALVGFCIYFAGFTEYRYGTDAWPQIGPPASGTAAQASGLREGDRILSIGGTAVPTYDSFRTVVKSHPNTHLTITVVRAGTQLDLAGVIGARPTKLADGTTGPDEGYLGVGPEAAITRSVPEGIQAGFTEFGREVGGTVVGIGRIFSPSGISHLFNMVTGKQADDPTTRPTSIVGISRVGADAVRSGAGPTIALIASLNLALGLFNLLPLLPFDGGHLLIASYERLRSRDGRRHHVDLARLMPFLLPVIAVVLFVVAGSFYLDAIQNK